MLQIRSKIFETNSSSMHSLTFVSDDEMRKFDAGELFFDRWKEALVTREEKEINSRCGESKHIYSIHELPELGDYLGGGAFCETVDLPDGGHANYICFYGHD